MQNDLSSVKLVSKGHINWFLSVRKKKSKNIHFVLYFNNWFPFLFSSWKKRILFVLQNRKPLLDDLLLKNPNRLFNQTIFSMRHNLFTANLNGIGEFICQNIYIILLFNLFSIWWNLRLLSDFYWFDNLNGINFMCKSICSPAIDTSKYGEHRMNTCGPF